MHPCIRVDEHYPKLGQHIFEAGETWKHVSCWLESSESQNLGWPGWTAVVAREVTLLELHVGVTNNLTSLQPRDGGGFPFGGERLGSEPLA